MTRSKQGNMAQWLNIHDISIGPSGIDPLGKTNSSHIFLRAKGERMAYMLDRKGKFTDVKLFDGLWYNLTGR